MPDADGEEALGVIVAALRFDETLEYLAVPADGDGNLAGMGEGDLKLQAGESVLVGAVELKDHIARTGLSQSEAAKLLGVTQPRISDLMRGKIELFGLDTLVNMIGAAGLHVEMRISDAA